MSSDAHLRRDHGTASSTSPYIDWGPDLPTHYEGGRARLLVVNPTSIYASWESDLPAPTRWRLEVVLGGTTHLDALELPGGLVDTWLHVPAGTQGEVHLQRDGVTVAILPFKTPPDRPSANTAERWGRLDARGHLHRDASPVVGRAVAELEAIEQQAQAATSSTLSGSNPHNRP